MAVELKRFFPLLGNYMLTGESRITDVSLHEASDKFLSLVEGGAITEESLLKARDTAMARGVELESVLLRELGVPRETMLASLARHFGCESIQYDERVPVSTPLFDGLQSEVLLKSRWFPVMQTGQKAIIAAANPASPEMRDEAMRMVPAEEFEFRVALYEDIQWYIQDYLHAKPKDLIGIERTGLAYWRNNMAFWRTRLASYRTDLARARTSLKLLRWGLAMIALGDALTRIAAHPLKPFYGPVLLAGIALAIGGLYDYLKVRRSRMSAPGERTLVEMTGVNIHFTERYQLEGTVREKTEKTMLSRLGDRITPYSTILYPSPASKERTHLARERNMLAAQRTIAGCHRTIYARARTGLSFIRTGISFMSAGLVMRRLLGPSPFAFLDFVLMAAGFLMTVDGLLWYLPVREVEFHIAKRTSDEAEELAVGRIPGYMDRVGSILSAAFGKILWKNEKIGGSADSWDDAI